MPKRSRYENVRIISGNIEVHSSGKTYHVKDIIEWEPFAVQSEFNPEEVQYCVTLVGTDYNMVLVCANEFECNTIIDELTDQSIGKRI
jgi:hypothetical protein